MTSIELEVGAILAALAIASALALRPPGRRAKSPVVELAGFTWTRSDFCRGWLITGDTGSGKTRSGITPLLYQVFKKRAGMGRTLHRRQRTLLGNALRNGAPLRP
jgi:hypothetical protein